MEAVTQVALIGVRIDEAGRKYFIQPAATGCQLPTATLAPDETPHAALARLATNSPVLSDYTLAPGFTYQYQHHTWTGADRTAATIHTLAGRLDATTTRGYEWLPYPDALDQLTSTGALHALNTAHHHFDRHGVPDAPPTPQTTQHATLSLHPSD